MRVRHSVVLAASLAVITAAALTGCSKSSSPTSPYGGGSVGGGAGGGGATNTPFNSGTLTTPAGFSHAFPVSGSVGYHCNFHVSLGMVGTVVVSSAATDSVVTVTASGTSFTPSSVTIKPGGIVHWSITSGTHTVTSD